MSGLKWYEKAGRSADVACSTRVRLARNLKGFPFPGRASEKDKQEIIERVRGAILNSNSVISKEFSFCQLGELSREAAVSLCERHLVSPEFIADRHGKAVLISADESVSIMINEEDHVRVQVLMEGESLKEALETADRIDTLLSENLDFAYDKDFGYLTQCPTNLGTGMRASLTMHLPALSEAGGMGRVGENLSKLGLTLRGSFGEGTRAVGEMYQISNQITLGLSEGEAIENLLAIAGQLMEQERELRRDMCAGVNAQDRIGRAAGVLKHARLMSGEEAVRLLSLVRLGLSQGMLEGAELGVVNGLFVKTQPATLMADSGGAMEAEERDAKRAKILREALSGVKDAVKGR